MKSQILRIAKWLGLFFVARQLTRRQLRILCFHGFSFADEAAFRPKLFMTAATFQRRLELIRKYRFDVLPLETAVERLEAGSLRRASAVITIDDGFFSVAKIAAPLLAKFRLPATLYVSSYYVVKQTPIFRLVIQYMLWKTSSTEIEIPDWRWLPNSKWSLGTTEERHQLAWLIIDYGETLSDEKQRMDIARQLGEKLTVPFEQIDRSRALSLLSESEITDLSRQGMDIQLHTHRHRFPLGDRELAEKEIHENRSVLENATGGRCDHFCYPSGIWSHEQTSWLEALDVRSATTCDPGTNDMQTPLLALRRFLDSEATTDIEFEAELAGFTELARRIRRRIRVAHSSSQNVAAADSPR